jgi:hypothetical protein
MDTYQWIHSIDDFNANASKSRGAQVLSNGLVRSKISPTAHINF